MQNDNRRIAIAEAKSAQRKPHTQIEELRETLATIEWRIAKLKEISSVEALEILTMLDQASERLDALERASGRTSSESALLESLVMQLNKREALFVNKIGGPTRLQQARQARQPDENYQWWFIDESLAQKRLSKIRRWTIGAGVVGILLIVLIVVYNQFLAPDPVFQAGIGFQQSAENNLILGNYEEALAAADQAIERLPDQPELYVMRGVIYEMLDQPDFAGQDFKRAREFLDDESFYTHRAKYYLMANQAERSIADAEMALSINPDSAISLLYLGQAYELSGDISTAIDYYEAASQAAERTGNVQTQVIARMNLAQALQKVGPVATETPAE